MLRKTAFFNTILLVLMLSSCRSSRIIEHEVVRHDSIYIATASIDTIVERDSVHIYEKGDTVIIYKDKYKYKVKERTDTVYIDRTDTITDTRIETKIVTETDWKAVLWAFVFGLFTPIGIYIILHKRK